MPREQDRGRVPHAISEFLVQARKQNRTSPISEVNEHVRVARAKGMPDQEVADYLVSVLRG